MKLFGFRSLLSLTVAATFAFGAPGFSASAQTSKVSSKDNKIHTSPTVKVNKVNEKKSSGSNKGSTAVDEATKRRNQERLEAQREKDRLAREQREKERLAEEQARQAEQRRIAEEKRRAAIEAEKQAQAEAKRQAEEAERVRAEIARQEAERRAEEQRIAKEIYNDYLNGYNCYYGIGGSQNYEKAANYFRMSAERGFAEAQYMLGRCYYEGNGVEEDNDQAVAWLEKATKQEHARAYKLLGDCYYGGYGKPKSESKAIECYQFAADRNDFEAMRMLGVVYFDQEKYDKAFVNFKKAADLGDNDSQFMTGYCYQNNYGVRKSSDNYAKALDYYQKAANDFNPLASAMLGYFYREGLGCSPNATVSADKYENAARWGLADAQYVTGLNYEEGNGVMKSEVLGKYWYEKAAEQGFIEAYTKMGDYYTRGTAESPNYDLAVAYYRVAADAGEDSDIDAQEKICGAYYNNMGAESDYNDQENLERTTQMAFESSGWAQTLLGIMQMRGYHYAQDFKEASKWLRSALNGDEPNSYTILCMGDLYYDGNAYDGERKLGVNYDRAVEYYQSAAKLNNTSAMIALAKCCLSGNGMPKDYAKAAGYYQQAADLNDPYAQYALAQCYQNGLGVTANPQKALEWFEKARSWNISSINEASQPMVDECYGQVLKNTSDPAKARSFIESASKKGHRAAQYHMGCILRDQDHKDNLAVKWFDASAQQGYVPAMVALADCYREGRGYKKDLDKARMLYNQAVAAGNTEAQSRLDEMDKKNKKK